MRNAAAPAAPRSGSPNLSRCVLTRPSPPAAAAPTPTAAVAATTATTAARHALRAGGRASTIAAANPTTRPNTATAGDECTLDGSTPAHTIAAPSTGGPAARTNRRGPMRPASTTAPTT